jgi:hypothetical protein
MAVVEDVPAAFKLGADAAGADDAENRRGADIALIELEWLPAMTILPRSTIGSTPAPITMAKGKLKDEVEFGSPTARLLPARSASSFMSESADVKIPE